MRVAIVGGKLQGTEVAYLAQKAGFAAVLVDKNRGVPAESLCEKSLVFTFTRDSYLPPLGDVDIDLIIPACENPEALAAVGRWANEAGIPYAHDPYAYRISCSKQRSDNLFAEMGLPIPLPFPECGFPVIAKPDGASGSAGVTVLADEVELSRYREEAPGDTVFQEYLAGPSYSIEVLGRPGEYRVCQVTEIHLDDHFDCRMISAPTFLASYLIHEMESMAVTLATEIGLCGIMDVEVILHDSRLKLLEIDARFPSQTPITVYWSTGVNMVAMLAEIFAGRASSSNLPEACRHVVVEHFKISGGEIQAVGEGELPAFGPLAVRSGFCGAEEALVSRGDGQGNWVTTLIHTGGSIRELEEKRHASHARLSELGSSGEGP